MTALRCGSVFSSLRKPSTVTHHKEVEVTQTSPTLRPMDYGILQARILEWVAFPFSRGIFPTQGLNPGLLHCRQIWYQLSHKGSLCPKF